MSREEDTDDRAEPSEQAGALNHGTTESEYAKHWANRAGQDTELPPDDVDVKSEWIGTTIYLPPALRDELNLLFQEYKYECNRHGDVDLKKLRHFYPLVVALGMERLEKTEAEDLPPLLSYIADEYE